MGWLIALQDEPDDADLKKRFDAWRATSAENAHAWDEASRVSTLVASGLAGVAPAMAPARRVSHPGLARPARARRFSLPLVIGVGFAATGLALFIQPMVSVWFAADYATGVAETRQIILDDGSTVLLGADSAIAVAMTSDARSVRLLSGEAYFEVQSDSERPFTVDAGLASAQVLGTVFDVRRLGDSVSVAVGSGRVAVSAHEPRGDLENPLVRGDWVRVDPTGWVERGSGEPELAGGWRKGLLVVKDRPVAEVVDEISRHYRGTIVVAPGGLGSRRVTGVYNVARPVDALNAVAQAHGAHVRQVGPWVSVISPY